MVGSSVWFEGSVEAPFPPRQEGTARFSGSEILAWLDRRTRYAVKAPFYQWVGLKSLIQERRRWKCVASDVEGVDTTLWLAPWQRFVRIAVYRKRVRHESPKNYQLDLFDPDDGHWEYSAIATNHMLGLKALWHFMAGRGAHEKVLAELKHGYAFATIPSPPTAPGRSSPRSRTT
jgi:hypothetical protein